MRSGNYSQDLSKAAYTGKIFYAIKARPQIIYQ